MAIQFCSLGSGSCGNATYICAGGARILVDAGLTGKAAAQALMKLNVLPETLNAILVTHEHVDHVRGVGVLSRRYRVPVYANAPTWEAMGRLVGEVPPPLRRVFQTGEDFFVGDLSVLPFPIPHDTVEPVAFRVFHGGLSVAVATDMGRVSGKVLRHLSGTDLVLLESNHDPDMLLHNERYTASLKQRIMGNYGHLSNAACAAALLRLFESGVRHALLGHLSQDNNTPELAMRTVEEELIHNGVHPGRDIFLDMAWRDRMGELYTIG